MKKKILLIAMSLLVAAPTAILASSATPEEKEAKKERKELTESTRKEIDKKAGKEARKAAKQFKKEGWKVNPGALPLEKQLDKSYIYQYEPASDGTAAYYMGEGRAVGQTYDAAALQARMNARQEIAGKIETDITTLIESSVANEQLTASQAASASKVLSKTEAFISQTLSNLLPSVECYRELKNGNIEVFVSYAYSKEQAQKVIAQSISKSLSEEAQGLTD